MNDRITAALAHWPFLAPLPQRPNTGADYQGMVEALDAVLDAGEADEKHPLTSLADYLSNLIEQYEAGHHPVPCNGGGASSN